MCSASPGYCSLFACTTRDFNSSAARFQHTALTVADACCAAQGSARHLPQVALASARLPPQRRPRRAASASARRRRRLPTRKVEASLAAAAHSVV